MSANVYLKRYVWVLIWFDFSLSLLLYLAKVLRLSIKLFSARQVSLRSNPLPASDDKRDTMSTQPRKTLKPWAGFMLEPGYRISHLCEEKEMNRNITIRHVPPPFLPVVHSLYLITTKWGYVSFAVKQLFYNSNKMFCISLIMVSRSLGARPR